MTLEFELEHDLDTAAQDVRDKLNVTMRRLPRDIEPPALGKADYSQFPIIIAPIASDLPATETTEYVDEHIKPALESIPGAAGVQLWGGRERNLRIWIDPGALRARNLAVERRARRAAPRARRAAGRLHRGRTRSSGRSRPTPSSARWPSSRT